MTGPGLVSATLALLTITLTVYPKTYRIDWDSDEVSEVQLVIWSDYSEPVPFESVQVYDKEGSSKSLVVPRNPLPKGSYVLQVEAMKWEGCPAKCEEVLVERSETVIIKVP